MRFILAALAALLASGASAQTFEMKLAASLVGDPNVAWLTEFKNRIEAKTNGRIAAKVFPGGQLGSPADIVSGLQLGTIEMYSIPPGFLKGVAAPFEVVEAPGLFGSHDQAHRIVTDPAFRDGYLRLAEAKGMLGIAIWVYGPSGAYVTRSPIKQLADFRGMKIGVRATKVETEILERLGGVGVPVNWPEAVPSIQAKVTDGQRSSHCSGWNTCCTPWIAAGRSGCPAMLRMPFTRSSFSPKLATRTSRKRAIIAPLTGRSRVMQKARMWSSWRLRSNASPWSWP